MSQVVASTWTQERKRRPNESSSLALAVAASFVGADWGFLPPNRCSERVLLYWGVPRPAVLAAVARQSRTLLVASPDGKRLHALQRPALEDDLQTPGCYL